MQPEDRLIHFSTELIHPPVQHQRPDLQRLYYELSQIPGAGYDNTDFNAPGACRFHSRRGQKTQSIAVFLPDRLVLIEEWADIALSQFVERIKAVGERAAGVFALKPFAAQSVTLRSTFSLTHHDDAADFLLHRACKLEGMLQPHFGRPLVTGGLRFVFPETPDHLGTLHVLAESFRHNPREIFVEVKGLFDRNAMLPNGLDAAAEHVQVVRRFILDRVFPFLNQFDVPG